MALLLMVLCMGERSIFTNLVRQADGAYSAVYGPYLLQSALQPIFREHPDGRLQIAAFKGLIRASAGDTPTSPGEFFQGVPEEERTAVDGLCRSLHILNAGLIGRRDTALIMSVHSGLYRAPHAMRQEVEWLRLAAHEAGIAPERIACEIRQLPGDDAEALALFADRLHEAGFSIAIDEYTGDDRDLARLERLKPQFVAFDTSWLHEFAENSAGLALLRVMKSQFADRNIEAIVGGIETPETMALCREMGGPLMQGFLLARPELAPTHFNTTFPDIGEDRPAADQPAAISDAVMPVENRIARPVRHFGRRGV